MQKKIIMTSGDPPETVTILLVEDDEVDAMAVERGFAKQHIGNPIVKAVDGLEALDILRGENGRERLPRPYLILLDLNMPRMNGTEFLQVIRRDEELRRSLVFVLTTSDDERDKLHAYDNSVAGYILKSEMGRDFIKLIQMLEKVVLTIQFPPDAEA